MRYPRTCTGFFSRRVTCLSLYESFTFRPCGKETCVLASVVLWRYSAPRGRSLCRGKSSSCGKSPFGGVPTGKCVFGYNEYVTRGCESHGRVVTRPQDWRRRDGRVAEGARLESVFRGNSNVGSNPTLSASSFAVIQLGAIHTVVHTVKPIRGAVCDAILLSLYPGNELSRR